MSMCPPSPLICQLLLEFRQSSTRYDDDDSGTSTSTSITGNYGDRDDQSSTPTTPTSTVDNGHGTPVDGHHV